MKRPISLTARMSILFALSAAAILAFDSAATSEEICGYWAWAISSAANATTKAIKVMRMFIVLILRWFQYSLSSKSKAVGEKVQKLSRKSRWKYPHPLNA